MKMFDLQYPENEGLKSCSITFAQEAQYDNFFIADLSQSV